MVLGFRTRDRVGREALGWIGRAWGWAFGFGATRVERPSGVSAREASGVFFGTHCEGTASEHLAPLLIALPQSDFDCPAGTVPRI